MCVCCDGACKRLKLFSVVGVSVLAGVCHNLGQLAVAVAVLGGSWAGWYLPWLMLAGCVTGIFIGVCAGAVNRRCRRRDRIRQRENT